MYRSDRRGHEWERGIIGSYLDKARVRDNGDLYLSVENVSGTGICFEGRVDRTD